MRKRYVWQLLLCVVPGILIQGCCTYTTYQTARALPPGRVAPGYEVGLGATPGTGERPGMLDVGPTIRVGIAKNLDVGLRPELLTADAKYQFLKGPLDGAFDLGVSYLPPVNLGIESEDIHWAFGLYPMVLFSQQHGSVTYSYGARFIYYRRGHAWSSLYGHGTEAGRFFMPGAVLGLSVVKKSPRLRFSPELSVYYCRLSGQDSRLPLAFGGGLGIQVEPGPIPGTQ